MPVPYQIFGCRVFSLSLQGKFPLHLPFLNDFWHWVKFKWEIYIYIFVNSNALEKCGSDARKQCRCYHLLLGVILQARSCAPFWQDLSKYPCAWHRAFHINSDFTTAPLLPVSLELTPVHPSQHRVLAGRGRAARRTRAAAAGPQRGWELPGDGDADGDREGQPGTPRAGAVIPAVAWHPAVRGDGEPC